MQAFTETLSRVEKGNIVRFSYGDKEYKGEVMSVVKTGGYVTFEVHNGDYAASLTNLRSTLPITVYR